MLQMESNTIPFEYAFIECEGSCPTCSKRTKHCDSCKVGFYHYECKYISYSENNDSSEHKFYGKEEMAFQFRVCFY